MYVMATLRRRSRRRWGIAACRAQARHRLRWLVWVEGRRGATRSRWSARRSEAGGGGSRISYHATSGDHAAGLSKDRRVLGRSQNPARRRRVRLRVQTRTAPSSGVGRRSSSDLHNMCTTVNTVNEVAFARLGVTWSVTEIGDSGAPVMQSCYAMLW